MPVQPEYYLSEQQIKDLLLTGSMDAFLDCLDFAPEGVMQLVKKYAIELLKNSNLKELLKERIKKLQFHINYNYEDFIAGQTIENQDVVTRKGFIFDIVEQSKKKIKITLQI